MSLHISTRVINADTPTATYPYFCFRKSRVILRSNVLHVTKETNPDWEMGMNHFSFRNASFAKSSAFCASRFSSYPVDCGGYRLFTLLFQGEGRKHLQQTQLAHLSIE